MSRKGESSFEAPPYTITIKAADYLVKIVEAVLRLDYAAEFRRDIRLHRENRLRSIHASLAIEGNTLSLDEVTAVIEGRVVAGRQEEIKEVRNAYEAYDMIMLFDPYAIGDFLKAHKLMTQSLIEESGMFRSGDVGVFDGDKAVHIGALPQFVSQMVETLFAWAKASELHPILKSAVVHYEIETIHPFADGNGRMGRLWQTLILAKWNAIFAWIPMESILYQNKLQYYQAIEDARKANDSGVFIEFTLSAIFDILAAQDKHQDKRQVELTDTQYAVLKALESKALSRKEVFAAIGMNGDSRAFKRSIEPLLTEGFVEMTVPDKPNSKLQKYRLTNKGRSIIESLGRVKE